MIVKIILAILALVNGVFMLVDGLHVVVKGKYLGPEKPGPWATLFYKLKIDVFRLGPLFIVLGLGWLIWVYTLWFNLDWAFIFGQFISIVTLWYIKVGTFISILIIALLLIFRQQLAI